MANNLYQGVLKKQGNMNFEMHNLETVWQRAVAYIKSVISEDLRQKVHTALPGLKEKLTAQGKKAKNQIHDNAGHSNGSVHSPQYSSRL